MMLFLIVEDALTTHVNQSCIITQESNFSPLESIFPVIAVQQRIESMLDLDSLGYQGESDHSI